MTNERKIQLGSSVDPTGAKDGLKQIEQAGVQTATALGKSAAEAGKAIDGIGDGGEKAARKLQAAERGIIGSIQRATAAAQAGERGTAAFYESLARSRGVSSDVLRPYLDQLRAAEQASRAAAAGVGQIGVSAAQTAAALRGVPAQFTDIVTSIASGQQPLTVFLQQGGQLKDMFGGVGAAARALGGYVLGLVNPFTLAAAAAGALGLAYKFGSDEASAYSRAIILSGNVAGVTAGQLEAMARGVAALGAGTQGRAAEILAQIAGSADIGAGNMQRFVAAALGLEKVGGPAAEKTAEAFRSLAKEPLAAALKLNEATNFLTAGTYEQIKALEAQGRTADAAKVAQEAYAAAIESRAPQLVGSLGLVERAWMAVKNATKGAVDAALEVGRGNTLEGQIAAVRDRIAQAQSGIYSRDKVPALQQELALLQEQQRLLNRGAEAAAAQAAAVRAAAEWDKQAIKYQTDGKRLADEILLIRQRGLAAGKSEVLVNELIAAAVERVAKAPASSGKSGKLKDEEESAKAYARALGALGEIQQQATASGEGLSKTQAKLREIQSDPAWTKYNAEQQKFIIGQAAAAQAAEDQAAAVKAGAKVAAEAARDYQQYIKALSGRGDAVAQQVQALQDEEAAAKIAATGRLSLKAAIEEVTIARLQDAQVAAMGNPDAVAAIQREIDARMKLRDAISAQDARKAADDTAKEWARAADKIGDSITDALMRGFESGKGFARTLRDTVVNMFKSMVLRPIISAVVSPVAGALTGALGFASGAAAAGAGGAGVGAAAGLTGLAAGMGAFGAGVSSGLTAWGAGGSVTGLLGSGSALFAGGAANGLGVIAGALAPIALGVAALTSILGRFDKSGTPHVGAQAMYSAAGGLQTATSDPSLGFWMSPGYVHSGVQTAVTGFAQSITSILDKAATTFGKQAGFSVSTGFADDSSSDGAFGSLMIQRGGQSLLNWNDNRQSRWAPRIFADGKAGAKEYAAELARSVRTTLDQIGLPSWASGILQSLGDAPGLDQLQQAVDQIAQMRTVFSQLGASLGITESQVVALAQTFGGVDALASSLGSYMSALYSESDRLKMAQESLSASFAQLGQSVPANAAAYRALVDAQDLSTDAGRATYAAMVKLAPAFAEVTAAANEAAAEQARLAEQVATQRNGLETQLLRLYGNTNELRRRELAALEPTNRALQQRIYDLEDAKAAAEVAERWIGNMKSAGQSISAFVAELRGATRAPAQNLAALRASYESDLKLARAGDVEASDRIVDSARALVEATRKLASDPVSLAVETSRIAVDLQSLPATETWQQTLINKLAAVQANTATDGAIAQAVAAAGANVARGIGSSATGRTVTFDPKDPLQSIFNATRQATQGTLDLLTKATSGTLGLYVSLARNQNADGAMDIGVNFMRGWSAWGGKGMPIRASAFAAGGAHSGGLRMVGENGPELEATGPARIWSADQTTRMLGGFDQAAMLAELRALRAEVVDMRAETRATAGHTAAIARLQKRWDGDGLLTRTETA